MVHDLNDVLQRLNDRGTEVAQPLGRVNSQVVENALNLHLGRDFRNVYLSLNGFESYDWHSHISIWGMSKIIESTAYLPVLRDAGGTAWLPIGDFLIESDIIIAAVEEDLARTKFLYEGRVLADSIEQLLSKLASGEYDFGSR